MALTSSQPVALNWERILRKPAVKFVCTVNVANLANPVETEVSANNDTVLLAGQTSKAANGVYIADGGGSLTRHTSYDAAGEFAEPFLIPITEGDGNTGHGTAGDVYVFNYPGSAITLNTTALIFTKTTAAPAVLTPI